MSIEWHSSMNWKNYLKESNKHLEGEWFWGYFRDFRTAQERRYACDEEHKPYIRGKRRLRQLPDPWDAEKKLLREKSWKARSKEERQWGLSLPRRIDTAGQPKPNDTTEMTE